MAETVIPALVEPVPVINIARLLTFEIYFNIWDFPEPVRVR